ncbi:MAG: immunity protein Imm33 domain-containing protein [Archangium sp.]
MATLSCFFAIYTDGAALTENFPSPAGADVFLGEMGTLLVPGAKDELFGPHVTAFQHAKFKRGFLLGFRREVKGRSETFFSQVRASMIAATRGVNGFGLDVLRLWPFPLEQADEALPEHLIAEDLFSVGFTDMGDHGVRGETVGLAKLGQREITFEFRNPELMEEAALMCGHLAEWFLEHNRRIEHAQSMSLGFDRISFFAADGGAGGPFRGWHPPLIQKLVPPNLFDGVGVLEVKASPPGSTDEFEDLTVPLTRSRAQRLLLEELDLSGDSPHSSSTAQVKGYITGLEHLVAHREESESSKDSGWRLRSTAEGDSGEVGVMTLADLSRRAPGIVRYLALPVGVKLSWNDSGALEIDRSRVELDEDTDDDLPS